MEPLTGTEKPGFDVVGAPAGEGFNFLQTLFVEIEQLQGFGIIGLKLLDGEAPGWIPAFRKTLHFRWNGGRTPILTALLRWNPNGHAF